MGWGQIKKKHSSLKLISANNFQQIWYDNIDKSFILI